MKKLICFALSIAMFLSVTAFAVAEKSDVERWREYSAPYVSELDLNGDGALDGLDIFAFWHELHPGTSGKESSRLCALAARIVGVLLNYPGDTYDLDHNGKIGNGDLYISTDILSITGGIGDAFKYAERARSVSDTIARRIRENGIETAPAKDVSTLDYPETVKTALANKNEPFYSTGRTLIECLREDYPESSRTMPVISVTIHHEYCDPMGARYDESFFPELDLIGVEAYNYYRDASKITYADWKKSKNFRLTINLCLGDTETVESALEKLEHRHYADIFFASPYGLAYDSTRTFVELPVSEKTFDESSPEVAGYLERYAEYTAPYVDRYDLNGDGAVNAKDFVISYETHSNDYFTGWEESAAIGTILLRFDEMPCDISRNGLVGEYDIALARDVRTSIRNAVGDCDAPSEDEIKLAILDQGGITERAAKDPSELEYPDLVATALENKKPVSGKTFTEQFRDDLETNGYHGWTEAMIEVVLTDEILNDASLSRQYDESFFPELDLVRVRNYFGILYLELDDTESVPGAIAKLEHRRGADIKLACPDYNGIAQPACDVGDLNGDGKTNSRDVIELMKTILESRAASGKEKTVLDVNCDGKINAKDVILLMKKVVNGSVVTGDTSLYCRILGHKLTASYAKETVHNAYAASPHCVQNTYLVISCGREGCGHIEKILVSSKRIANCHG